MMSDLCNFSLDKKENVIPDTLIKDEPEFYDPDESYDESKGEIKLEPLKNENIDPHIFQGPKWDLPDEVVIIPEQGEKQEESEEDSELDSYAKCKVCKKTFETDLELEFHLKRAAFEKSYKCCACGKPFRDMSQLHVHIRTHTGEKPYDCPVCGKKFSINGNLNKHIRTHTGERRFECDVCERKNSNNFSSK